MTQPARTAAETPGDLYVDRFGIVRALTPSPDCDCCLDGVLDMEDGPMGVSLPRTAVVALGAPALPAGSRNESREGQT